VGLTGLPPLRIPGVKEPGLWLGRSIIVPGRCHGRTACETIITAGGIAASLRLGHGAPLIGLSLSGKYLKNVYGVFKVQSAPFVGRK